MINFTVTEKKQGVHQASGHMYDSSHSCKRPLYHTPSVQVQVNTTVPHPQSSSAGKHHCTIPSVPVQVNISVPHP